MKSVVRPLAIVAAVSFCQGVWGAVLQWTAARGWWRVSGLRGLVQTLPGEHLDSDNAQRALRVLGVVLLFYVLAKARKLALQAGASQVELLPSWLIPFRIRDERALFSLWRGASAQRAAPPAALHLWFVLWSIWWPGSILADVVDAFASHVTGWQLDLDLALRFAHLAWAGITVYVFEDLAKRIDEKRAALLPLPRPIQVTRAAMPVPVIQAAELRSSVQDLRPALALKEGACPSCQSAMTGSRCVSCGAAARAGTYQTTEVLAASAGRRTYKARTEDGRAAVLKEISFATVPSAEAMDAFLREGRLLKQLRHPRLPALLDVFTEGSGAATRFYLAYLFIEGTTLSFELQHRPYTIDESLDVIEQLLQVLVYLHERTPPLIHRDIKPANIVRTASGALTLIDFGAARELEKTWHSGTMVGTIGYMPPEQLAGQVDLTSDLYAVGASALHLITRRAPWEMMDGPELQVPTVEASRAINRFLQKLVHRRRQSRFQSAREALRALHRARAPFSLARLLGSGAG